MQRAAVGQRKAANGRRGRGECACEHRRIAYAAQAALPGEFPHGEQDGGKRKDHQDAIEKSPSLREAVPHQHCRKRKRAERYGNTGGAAPPSGRLRVGEAHG